MLPARPSTRGLCPACRVLLVAPEECVPAILPMYPPGPQPAIEVADIETGASREPMSPTLFEGGVHELSGGLSRASDHPQGICS